MNSVKWDPQRAPTFWINHASRTVMRRFEQCLRPLGFGMAYLPVAMAIDQHGPMQQKELLGHARIEQPTMTSLLARMERDGLIVRKPDPEDARARLVSLTPRAKTALGRAKDAMLEVVDEALAGINAKEQDALMKTLKKLVANLDD